MVRFLLFFPSRCLRILTLINYICVFILQDADPLVVSPQKPVDVHLTAFQSMEWIGTLPFKWHRCFDTDDYCSSSETNLDLFQFATSFYKGVKGVKQIVRFSPLLYPIAGGFGKDSGGQALITDICQAARSLGNCALASHGGGGKSRNLPTRVLLCSNGRRYVPAVSSLQGAMISTVTGTDPGSYRKTTYIADKKNSRGCNSSGKALVRRKSTRRNTKCTCPAKIIIQVDKMSFFMVCGLGAPMGHNEITNRKRFLGAACLENVAAMAAANIQPAQAALFTKSRTGELFTRGQMAYVQGFSRMAQSLMDSGEHSMSSSSASSPP